MGLDPGRPIVALALTRGGRLSVATLNNPDFDLHSAHAALNAVALVAHRHPDWQVFLRPHPGELSRVGRLLARAQGLGLPAMYVDHGPAHECLAAADVLVCTESNLGIEAILWQKPVVNVVLDVIPARVFEEGLGPLFTEDDAVLIARNEPQIADAVEAALTDAGTRRRLLDARPASIRRFNHVNDGGATARVCTLALDMIENGKDYVRHADGPS